MGLCTNRVLMGQPLLALFISAKRRGLSPAPFSSASNAKRKTRERLNFRPLLAQIGGWKSGREWRPCPGISDINLFLYARTLLRSRRTLKCDEHGVCYFLFQEKRRLACVPTRNLESRSDVRENGATDGFAASAVTRRE